MNSKQPPLPPNQLGAPLAKRPPGRRGNAWTLDLSGPGYARMAGSSSSGYGYGGVSNYCRVLGHKKWMLLVSAVLSTLLAYIVTGLQVPVYRARSLVEIETLNENFLNMRNVSPTETDQGSQSPEYNIRTQIEVLQSRPILERALQKQTLEKRLLASVRDHKSVFSFPTSEPILPKPAAIIRDHEQALRLTSNALRVRLEPNTRILEITFDSKDSAVAADFVNAITVAFGEVTLENRWKATQNTSQWLSLQLQDVKIKLAKAQDELQNYAKAQNLTFLSQTNPTSDTTADERLKELQVEVTQTEGNRIVKQSAYEQAKRAPIDSLPEVVGDSMLKEYEVQLTTLRRQLADLSSSFTSQYPKIVSLRAQITTLENALEKERANIITRTHNEYDIALRREKLVSNTYAAVTGLITAQREKVTHYMLLKHEFDSTRQLYESLVQRVKEADLASAMKASDVHVIEAAVPPDTPYKPVRALNLAFGLLSGTFLGAAFVIQRARTYHGIQEPGDSVHELNVPELGVIPATTAPPSQFRRLLGKPGFVDQRKRPELTSWRDSPSSVAEAFRLTLASLLLPTIEGQRPKIIAFSSANPHEGKTTVVSNLAIALASINRKVLLVDGDLRKRRLHRIFELDNTRGLKEVLEGDVTVPIQETKIPNLFVLPSGKGAGETLFFTSTLRDLLNRVKADFDMILIDTPPLLQISDARMICHEANAVVLVVAQHTPRETVLQARQRLVDDGSNLIGSILNRWDPKTNVTADGYGDYFKYKDYYKPEKTPPA